MTVVDRLSSSEWEIDSSQVSAGLYPLFMGVFYEIVLQQLCYEIQNEAVAAQVAPSCLHRRTQIATGGISSFFEKMYEEKYEGGISSQSLDFISRGVV